METPDIEARTIRSLDLRVTAGFLRYCANVMEVLIDEDDRDVEDVLAPSEAILKELAYASHVAREALSDVIVDYRLFDPRNGPEPGGEGAT